MLQVSATTRNYEEQRLIYDCEANPYVWKFVKGKVNQGEMCSKMGRNYIKLGALTRGF